MIRVARGDRVECRQRPEQVELGFDATYRVMVDDVEYAPNGDVAWIRTPIGRWIPAERLVRVVEFEARKYPQVIAPIRRDRRALP